MTWPGVLVYSAHLLVLPVALIRPRFALLAIVATAAFRAGKLGPAIISTNQLEGVALMIVGFRLWKSAERLPWRSTDRLVFLTYGAILCVRVLQALFYDVGAYRLAQFSYQDVFRPLVYFFAIHMYLRAGGTPQRLLYAACGNIIVMCAAVLLEWRYFWSWRLFFGTELAGVQGGTGGALVSRFGYRLIEGPFGQWVATGTFLALYLPFALVALAGDSSRRAVIRAGVGLVGLGSSLLIGGRAAMLGAAAASATAAAILMLRPTRRLNWIPSWTPAVALGLAFTVSSKARAFAEAGYDYLYRSLFPGASEAQNLTDRSDLGAVLWKYIGDVPLIGYGWQVVREPAQLRMPIRYTDFEVNFAALYSYDLGVTVAMLWLMTLLLALFGAASAWMLWRGTERWTAALVIIISAALVPILGSNGLFYAPFAQPWLLAVALMTHAAAVRRRPVTTRRPLAHPQRDRAA